MIQDKLSLLRLYFNTVFMRKQPKTPLQISEFSHISFENTGYLSPNIRVNILYSRPIDTEPKSCYIYLRNTIYNFIALWRNFYEARFHVFLLS